MPRFIHRPGPLPGWFIVPGLLLAATSLIGVASLRADEEDPIRQKLDRVCVEFAETRDEVDAQILAHLEKQESVVRRSGNKEAVDQIKAERTVFEERGQWPGSVPVGLQRRHAAAFNGVRAEYARAVKSYTQMKQDSKAEAAERELQEFIAEHHPFLFEGAWQSRHGNGWSGTRTVRGLNVVDFNGQLCNWKRENGIITVTWKHGGWERLNIDFENPNKLEGKTERGLNSVWTRKKK